LSYLANTQTKNRQKPYLLGGGNKIALLSLHFGLCTAYFSCFCPFVAYLFCIYGVLSCIVLDWTWL